MNTRQKTAATNVKGKLPNKKTTDTKKESLTKQKQNEIVQDSPTELSIYKNAMKRLKLEIDNQKRINDTLLKENNENSLEFDNVCREKIQLKNANALLKRSLDEAILDKENAHMKLAELTQERDRHKDIHEYIANLQRINSELERKCESNESHYEDLLVLSANTPNMTHKGVSEIKQLKEKIKDKEFECQTLIVSIAERDKKIGELINLQKNYGKNKYSNISNNDKIIKYRCGTSEANKGDIDMNKIELQNINEGQPKQASRQKLDIISETPKKSDIEETQATILKTKKGKKGTQTLQRQTILLLSDANGKDCAKKLNSSLPSTHQSVAIITTGAPQFIVAKNQFNSISALTTKDHYVLSGGIHHNYFRTEKSTSETVETVRSNLDELLKMSKNTNALITSIPYRLDYKNDNFKIYEINKIMCGICSKYKHATFIWTTDYLDENDYNQTGTYLNYSGKNKLCGLIQDCVVKHDHDTSSSKQFFRS